MMRMAKTYTTVSVPQKTKAKFDARKEDYYGMELADQISNEKFVEDLLEEVRE
jgi:hypothetical protein